MKLHIGPGFSLPLDFVTQTISILAIRGAGKSHTASVMAEEMLKRKQQIVAVDPTGAWYGLKSSRDGESAGYPVVVFGGEHADVPLEPAAGEMVARSIVDHGFSAIIDLRLLRKHQWYEFLAPFLETLYRMNREPLHVFVDEAHKIAPQKPFGEQARTLGAIEDIVQMGRNRGLGCTLISQRPAVLNKNVLTQCPTLCVMRIAHNLDLKTIRDWAQENGVPAEVSEMVPSLPSLPTGTAWFCLSEERMLKKVAVRERETFDSGRTPKVGERLKPPKVLAAVDLAKLGEQIKATVERARENDPKALRAKVAELQRQLAKPTYQKAEPVVDIAGLKAEAEARVMSERKFLIDSFQEFMRKMGEKVGSVLQTPFTPPRIPGPLVLSPRMITSVPRLPQDTPARPGMNLAGPYSRTPQKPVQDLDSLPPGEKAVLVAAAQYPEGVERDQLSVLTGYKRSSRDAYVARLQTKGYISVNGRGIVPTEAGIAALGTDYEPLPTGKDLQDYWMRRLPEGEKKILEVLVHNYPNSVERDHLDEKTDYKRSSRDAYLARLKARRLVEYAGRGEVIASKTLFEG